MSALQDNIRALGRRVGQALVKIHRTVPAGLRTVLGLMLVVGGIFGFLPVLGFWMVPLGLLVIGLDIGALRRVWRARRRKASDESDPETCDKNRG